MTLTEDINHAEDDRRRRNASNQARAAEQCPKEPLASPTPPSFSVNFPREDAEQSGNEQSEGGSPHES